MSRSWVGELRRIHEYETTRIQARTLGPTEMLRTRSRHGIADLQIHVSVERTPIIDDGVRPEWKPFRCLKPGLIQDPWLHGLRVHLFRGRSAHAVDAPHRIAGSDIRDWQLDGSDLPSFHIHHERGWKHKIGGCHPSGAVCGDGAADFPHASRIIGTQRIRQCGTDGDAIDQLRCAREVRCSGEPFTRVMHHRSESISAVGGPSIPDRVRMESAEPIRGRRGLCGCAAVRISHVMTNLMDERVGEMGLLDAVQRKSVVGPTAVIAQAPGEAAGVVHIHHQGDQVGAELVAKRVHLIHETKGSFRPAGVAGRSGQPLQMHGRIGAGCFVIVGFVHMNQPQLDGQLTHIQGLLRQIHRLRQGGVQASGVLRRIRPQFGFRGVNQHEVDGDRILSGRLHRALHFMQRLRNPIDGVHSKGIGKMVGWIVQCIDATELMIQLCRIHLGAIPRSEHIEPVFADGLGDAGGAVAIEGKGEMIARAIDSQRRQAQCSGDKRSHPYDAVFFIAR